MQRPLERCINPPFWHVISTFPEKAGVGLQLGLGTGNWCQCGHRFQYNRCYPDRNATHIPVLPSGTWDDWNWKKLFLWTSQVTPPCQQVTIASHLTLTADACAVCDCERPVSSTPASGWARRGDRHRSPWKRGDRWWRAAVTEISTVTLIASLAFIKVGQ